MLEIGPLGACIAAFSPTTPTYVAAFLATALIPFAVWLSRHQTFPGQRPLVFAHIGAMWWLWTAAFELAVPAASCKILFAGLSHAGIALVATAWMCFVYRYTVGVSVAGKRAQDMLMITVPLTASGMALTSGIHGLFYTPATRLVEAPEGAFVVYDHGLLFNIELAYLYVVVCISLGLLLNAAITAQASGQLRYWLLFLLGLVPSLANLGHVYLGMRVWGYDPTPFMFAIVFVIYVVMLISDSTLDLGALARRQVYNALPQAIFVVGGGETLRGGNPAANALLKDCARTFGARQRAETALYDLFERCREEERQRGVAMQLGDRYYDVEVQPIDPAVGAGHPPLGWIMIADDVTGTVRVQAELARAAEDAEAESRRDPLTGLSNRRPLEPRFREMVAEARETGQFLQLLLVDVDFFKSINDTYGHDQGDTALILVAQTLRSVFRENDAVFRIGGEEFLAIAVAMPERSLLHRLRMASARLQQKLKDDGTFRDPITFSAGLAAWPADGDTLEQLVRSADRRLLTAKRTGRNRFVGQDTVVEGTSSLGAPPPPAEGRGVRPQEPT